MSYEIGLVLAVLGLAVVLFVTEKLRMDLVALLVLGILALTNLVSPAQALSGFSSPAVVTVWAMFIISGALAVTGVANSLGRQILRLAGTGEPRLIAVIMLASGGMSAVMNNVGVAAMLLPVVIDIARRTKRPASRLLMPLALGSLLGGLTTLIGTPPNILVSDALRDYGLTPFGLFDFMPTGLPILLAGVLFVAFIGRHLLPSRDPVQESAHGNGPGLQYDLAQRLFIIRLPADSPLAGKTLAQSRLGSALQLNVLMVMRAGDLRLAPRPDMVIEAGDRFLVQGQTERLLALRQQRDLLPVEGEPAFVEQAKTAIEAVEATLSPSSPLVGRTVYQAALRRNYGVNLLAIRRPNDFIQRTNLQDTRLQAGDRLLLQAPGARLNELTATGLMLRAVSPEELIRVYGLRERIWLLRIPEGSALDGRSLVESRLGDAYGLTLLGLKRGETEIQWFPEPDVQLQAGDLLVTEGPLSAMIILRGLQQLEIDTETPIDMEVLQSAEVGLAEIILSPQTTLEGKSLRQLHFREKYGLNVLAIWRQGRAYRSQLRDMALQFGDAILLYGPRDKLRLLGREPDFLLLTEPAEEDLRPEKAILAVGILVAVLLPVLFGYLSIAIAAVVGATLMVLTRCLTMEEAYRYIEWPAVFLIAGMLPLGIAMEQTGAARFLAEGMISVVGSLGPHAVLAGIFILTSIATQIIPTAALVVLMAPIAFNTATDLGLSPLPLLMTVAIAASASFSSPVSHPANVMIMGPGGYRFIDYLRVGFPLTLVVLVITVLLVPIIWPFS
jgi:di/tricarboxylate transporter